MFPVKDQTVEILGFSWHIWPLSHFSIRSLKKVKAQGSSHCGAEETNQRARGCGFNPWPHSVDQESRIAMSCDVGCRCGLDPVLLWLWLRFNPSLGTSICRRRLEKKKKKKKKLRTLIQFINQLLIIIINCHGTIKKNYVS